MSFIVFFFFLLLKNSSADFTWYIVNGENAEQGEFPWMVLITNNVGMLHCGASLVGLQYVLTAAHCVTWRTATTTSYRVHVGLQNLSQISTNEDQVFRIIDTKIHPLHDPFTFDYDLALLKLDRNVRFTPNVKPICFVSPSFNLTGKTATAVGWGITAQDKGMSNELQKIEIPIWDWNECKSLYDTLEFREVTRAMLCAGDTESGKDACSLDSGGSLTIRSSSSQYLIGVISWGEKCSSNIFPGIYARVSVATHWIKYYVNQNESCASN